VRQSSSGGSERVAGHGLQVSFPLSGSPGRSNLPRATQHHFTASWPGLPGKHRSCSARVESLWPAARTERVLRTDTATSSATALDRPPRPRVARRTTPGGHSQRVRAGCVRGGPRSSRVRGAAAADQPGPHASLLTLPVRAARARPRGRRLHRAPPRQAAGRGWLDPVRTRAGHGLDHGRPHRHPRMTRTRAIPRTRPKEIQRVGLNVSFGRSTATPPLCKT
jgi:hypothetical protein